MLSLLGGGKLSIVSLLLDLNAQVLLVLFFDAAAVLVAHSLIVVRSEHVCHEHVVVESVLLVRLLHLRLETVVSLARHLSNNRVRLHLHVLVRHVLARWLIRETSEWLDAGFAGEGGCRAAKYTVHVGRFGE